MKVRLYRNGQRSSTRLLVIPEQAGDYRWQIRQDNGKSSSMVVDQYLNPAAPRGTQDLTKIPGTVGNNNEMKSSPTWMLRYVFGRQLPLHIDLEARSDSALSESLTLEGSMLPAGIPKIVFGDKFWFVRFQEWAMISDADISGMVRTFLNDINHTGKPLYTNYQMDRLEQSVREIQAWDWGGAPGFLDEPLPDDVDEVAANVLQMLIDAVGEETAFAMMEQWG